MARSMAIENDQTYVKGAVKYNQANAGKQRTISLE